ncbi:MAG: glycine--tRNA ligase subunit beta [Proteobacteria bacterium]|jgi:glycyl-tRNA synthetase beta chain|nr:glycine--tRNA ligase subunit beta [Pseudomonadota bacterium]
MSDSPASRTLVVEIVTEELPPRALKALSAAFAAGIAGHLGEHGYLEGSSATAPYATPRRLAAVISQVRAVAPDVATTQKLMPAKVAFDAAGAPSAALAKKLAALGRGELIDGASAATLAASSAPDPSGSASPPAADRLYVESDGKADYVYLASVAKGQPLAHGLAQALERAVAALPIPKTMSYARPGGYYNDVRFVRPAHRLVALHGTDVVPIEALGLRACRTTDGHRFMGRRAIEVASADAWAPALEAEGKVLPGFNARRAEIVRQLLHMADGNRVIMPDDLVDEVTSLVEWPTVAMGSFDREFLDVPHECLILTMQQNQRYFALTGSDGELLHHFLLVSNNAAADMSAIVRGNERVLRARLADAKFFFDQDRRRKLASRVDLLAGIVYHNRLGSQLDRVGRVRAIARAVAPVLGADPAHVDRAALLAKADLTTGMVGEFPELQGTMGRHYARFDGEAADVAGAIADHYLPRHAGDALPAGPVAQAVALADRMELLAGMFGIGALPTGDKDPFGLRRAAIGVLRIVVEQGLALPLPALVAEAFAAFAGVAAVKPDPAGLAAFMVERLRVYLRDQGYTANQVDAVLSLEPARIDVVPAQLAAVRSFEALPEAQALAAANKRIVNILRKADAEAAPAIDRGRLAPGAEHDLWLAFERLAPVVERHCQDGDYTGALRALASVKPAVDRFFDDVLVMADDPAVRANRLALLRGVAATMNRVADISRLAA